MMVSRLKYSEPYVISISLVAWMSSYLKPWKGKFSPLPTDLTQSSLSFWRELHREDQKILTPLDVMLFLLFA
ncbi:MAG: hypothetical protein A2V62_01445 [Nitrospirae bacterium RBG_19FT_COMBO_58_9]|nr:MAG: hypothetical protein A2V62_01445 [Nitrospirae bacterium RBG_19FT_COMBO_58_9]